MLVLHLTLCLHPLRLWSWPSVNAAELAKDIGVNRLHHAVKAGDIENVEALLDEYPELIEEEDQDCSLGKA